LVKRVSNYVEFIYCECGCGFTTSKYVIEKDGRVRKDRPKRFKDGHESRGKNNPHFGKFGKKHHSYKNEGVGYSALHYRIRRRKKKPELCEKCGLVPPDDAANISNKYLDNDDDFLYLCRSCHMRLDGRIFNLRNQKR
jgi:hypothetical protein